MSPQRRNFIFLAIVLGMLLAALDPTIVATALPTIVANLGDAWHQSWVVTGYLQRDGDQMWLTQYGSQQVNYVYSLLLAGIVDKLSRSPSFEGRPDRREVQAALQRIAHRVLAQRDWNDEAPTMALPRGGR